MGQRTTVKGNVFYFSFIFYYLKIKNNFLGRLLRKSLEYFILKSRKRS
ncbi:hypothetical protein HMPREF0813_00859 [Streptococcus anginosus F0211]|uniref:Uncharacterized protein n=1 Tax=Streptococcus anginosus F0211 TaxID=706437 RepID=E6J0T6_STRAP|nr:hypothetical protein HMPREF0813_00859 [Streptococcus anginosus F0211]EUB13032.1 hypothetical protein HMPREF1510_1448 [Streptococcus sp. ACC21]